MVMASILDCGSAFSFLYTCLGLLFVRLNLLTVSPLSCFLVAFFCLFVSLSFLYSVEAGASEKGRSARLFSSLV
jgi:hypothetical protein